MIGLADLHILVSQAKSPRVAAVSTVMLTMLLSACGDTSSPSPPSTSRSTNSSGSASNRSTKALSVRSPALTRSIVVPPRFRCRANSIWLPLEWSKPPKKTAEQVLAVGFNEITREQNAFVSRLVEVWLIGGLNPLRRRLSVGDLPPGAFMKAHHDDACPSGKAETNVVFAIFAMPPNQRVKTSEGIGLDTPVKLAENALAWGSMPTVYRKGAGG